MKLVHKSISFLVSFVIIISMAAGITITASAVESSGFVHSEGTHFVLNGNTFYVTGCNSYDLHRIDGWEIDKLMQEMQSNGVNVCRTWAFSSDWYCGFESYSNGYWNYNEDRFQQLDYIMYSAKQHGIKMILTLENYWEGFGGIDQKLEALGMESGTHQARSKWYTNETCKNWYKSYAEHLINRTNTITGVKYKDDPTVFAWGLMNEARFQESGEDSSSTTLRAWVDEMGAYVKSIDPNHMVSIELEGHGDKYGFGNDEGNSFVYVQQSPSVDYCSVHIYPDEEWCDMSVDTAANIMSMLIDDAHNLVGKPIIVGEFNASRSNPNQLDYWKAIFDTLYNKDAGGALFWNYSLNYIDKHTVMNGDSILDYFKEMSNKYAAKSSKIDTNNENIENKLVLQFEDGTVTNGAVKATSSSSYTTEGSAMTNSTGSGYAYLESKGDSVYVQFTAPASGDYTFGVYAASTWYQGQKSYFNIYSGSLSDLTSSTAFYPGTTTNFKSDVKTLNASLTAGTTYYVEIEADWGYLYLDKLEVTAPNGVNWNEAQESSSENDSYSSSETEIDSSSEIVNDDNSKTNTTVIECENYANGTYSNTSNVTAASSLNGFSGTGYASLNGSKTLYVPFTAPNAGTYTFTVSYARPQNANADIYFDRFDSYAGASYSTFNVDGVTYYQNAYQQVGSGSGIEWRTYTVTHTFNAGETKLIGLTDNNCIAYFDKITVTAPENDSNNDNTDSSSESYNDDDSEDDNTKSNTKIIECEDYANGTYSNTSNVAAASSLNGFSGTGYASLNGSKTLYVPFTAPKAGTYTFTVSYARPQNANADIYFDRFDSYSGASYSTFNVDGVTYYQNAYQQVGSGSSTEWTTYTVTHTFNAGETKLIGLTDNNCIAYFDSITVTANDKVF